MKSIINYKRWDQQVFWIVSISATSYVWQNCYLGRMGVLEWRNGPTYFWNGVVDGSGGHFWTGWEEWMALRFKWMVPKSGLNLLERNMQFRVLGLKI